MPAVYPSTLTADLRSVTSMSQVRGGAVNPRAMPRMRVIPEGHRLKALEGLSLASFLYSESLSEKV